MRKFTHLDTLDSPRRQPSKVPIVLLFTLFLIATPPLFEVAKLNLARFSVLGISTHVETPVLDTLSKQWETGNSEIRDFVTPLLARRRWNPKFVIPIAFFWTAVAALMLRRSH